MVGTLACPLAEAAVCLRQTTTPRNGEALHEFETGKGCRVPSKVYMAGHGGKDRATGGPPRILLRKTRALRPRCPHVPHTDIKTHCARAPAPVRLPPPTLRRMTPKRMASSARQLVASSPG